MITTWANKAIQPNANKADDALHQCTRCRAIATGCEQTLIRGWVCPICARAILLEQQQQVQDFAMGILY